MPCKTVIGGLFLLAFSLGVTVLARAAGPQGAPAQAPLVIGVLPEQDLFEQLRRYRPLADILSRRVGRGIELKVLPRYGNIVGSFQQGKLDGAFFGSFTYVLSQQKLGLRVLARPESPDGTSTYHGLLVVRADSGIRGPADMRGGVFAFVDQATTAGYLFPLAYFKEHGVVDYPTHFRETYFAGTHEGVVADVLDRKADAGALKNTVFRRFVSANPEAAQELEILAWSPPVPENALAVRADLDPALTDRLRNALLLLHEDEEGVAVLRRFGAARFIPTTDDDYAAVSAYAKTAGLDLATYDYINR
ncbi:MAG: phosphate/phosphite/phosphonate ABC transporter substrate-binding protein [Deferrisomatales bacterium]|nr:phosphate/phosphite/phosphonate ABC transporter substrate-binding protein [Deferrisomatales bacterium]